MSIRQVIGIHSCREALKVRTAQELKKMYVQPNWNKSFVLTELVSLARSKSLKPETIPLARFNR
ncbi:MAG: hypothetical protein OXN83_02495, partial [Oligoflexia bacterium]|nr:hypothetical protein [Oligoflexia bacterium]